MEIFIQFLSFYSFYIREYIFSFSLIHNFPRFLSNFFCLILVNWSFIFVENSFKKKTTSISVETGRVAKKEDPRRISTIRRTTPYARAYMILVVIVSIAHFDRYTFSFFFFFFYLRARTWRRKKYVIQAIFLASLSQKEGRKKRVVRDQEVEKWRRKEREREKETRAACCCWRSWHDKKR